VILQVQSKCLGEYACLDLVELDDGGPLEEVINERCVPTSIAQIDVIQSNRPGTGFE